jgi:CheY-like chemotaxis protein
MLDPEEIRWVNSTANELNNLLQVITESSQFLEKFCEENTDTNKYFGILRNGIERAARVTTMMLERAAKYEHEPHSAGSVPTTAVPPSLFPQAKLETKSSRDQDVAEVGDVKIWNPNGKRELIMIVDDEDFVTVLAQRVLSDQGYRVIIAKDGFQSLDIYKRFVSQIDLIILDFTMPIMDGSEVFNELREINPKVPVVLSSGFTEQDKLRWMLAKGLRGFIPKPYTQEKLLLQVRSVLDALKNER